jgi:4-hydroxybenzoate polyprenyltransferase
MIKTFRLINIFKNFLIFLPLIFSNREIFFSDLTKLIISFFIFTVLTSICYATNDYTDRFKDNVNKLKSKKKILSKKILILLNIFLIILLFTIYKLNFFFNIHLVFYIVSFYLYNFICKNIFLLDILFLVSFYYLRIFYGAEVIDLAISYWFLSFFGSLFIILSIFKRMIQISVNNIKSNKKKIIVYSYKNYPFFKKIIFSFYLINIFIFIFYLYEIILPNTFGEFSSSETFYNQNIVILCLIFVFYLFWLTRLIKLVFKKKVKNDIYLFILKDKISYLYFAIPIMSYLFYKILYN